MSDLSKEGQPFNPEQYTLEEILRSQNCALLVVDMQNDFMHPDGFFARKGRNIIQMQSIVPNVQKMIDLAHRAKVPIVFTQGSEDVKFQKPGPDLRRAVRWGARDGDGSVNSERGTFGWEFYGVSPEERDIVVEKHKWSAFDGKDKERKPLKQILDQLRVKTLVVAGVVAETCVETTVRDAYNNDYFVVIPRNSVGSNDAEQLNARMKYWDAGFVGDVLEESKIEEYWRPIINQT